MDIPFESSHEEKVRRCIDCRKVNDPRLCDKDGIEPNPENICKILEWPKMLLKYVKCYEWLRVWPLIHITKKDVPFQMDWKLQYSFCKNWRISYRTRYYGLSDVKWRIYSKKKTDASCYNAGAVLVKYKMAKKELFYVPVWPWTRPRIVIIAALTENYQQ